MEENGLIKKPVYTARVKAGYGDECYPKVYGLLEAIGLEAMAADHSTVLIKPNLVGTHEPPITTPAPLVGAIASFLNERCPGVRVIVGDGTGSLEYDTWRCFDELGYRDMAARSGAELIDLNDAPLARLTRGDLPERPEMFIPEMVMDSLLISVPVLKAHSLAGVTLTMKNMIGVAPPAHYQAGGHWKKSSFHERMHESIFELNCYRTPDLTVLDATSGMIEAHLWGAVMDPGPELVAASTDPVAIDAFGADLLGRDPNRIKHIAMADRVLGIAEPASVEAI